jgi:hypothetical protein
MPLRRLMAGDSRSGVRFDACRGERVKTLSRSAAASSLALASVLSNGLMGKCVAFLTRLAKSRQRFSRAAAFAPPSDGLSHSVSSNTPTVRSLRKCELPEHECMSLQLTCHHWRRTTRIVLWHCRGFSVRRGPDPKGIRNRRQAFRTSSCRLPVQP